ncbi:hypothetical protein PT974_01784 [Cladobotryum mycophilum]|uniref:Uncharacterized protein n=1 Tax=Cladobotryum mycophilum TaxID=491253 RepID=A0ABR0SXD6_9HYPO
MTASRILQTMDDFDGETPSTRHEILHYFRTQLEQLHLTATFHDFVTLVYRPCSRQPEDFDPAGPCRPGTHHKIEEMTYP